MTTEPMNSEAASQPSSYAAAEPIPVSIIKDETAEKVRAATYGGWSAFQFSGTEKQAVQVLRFDERRRRAVLLCLSGSSANSAISGITVPNPAAGAEWSYTVPAGTTLTLISIEEALTTSAVVGNRVAGITIRDASGTLVYSSYTSTNQPASTTNLNIFSNVPLGGVAAAFGYISNNLTIPAGWTINSSTPGIQAGDQYSSIQILGVVNSTTVSRLYLGSKAQISNGAPSLSGAMLTNGQSITVESATDIWCMPDGTNPLTLVVLDELYRT